MKSSALFYASFVFKFMSTALLQLQILYPGINVNSWIHLADWYLEYDQAGHQLT